MVRNFGHVFLISQTANSFHDDNILYVTLYDLFSVSGSTNESPSVTGEGTVWCGARRPRYGF